MMSGVWKYSIYSSENTLQNSLNARGHYNGYTRNDSRILISLKPLHNNPIIISTILLKSSVYKLYENIININL